MRLGPRVRRAVGPRVCRLRAESRRVRSGRCAACRRVALCAILCCRSPSRRSRRGRWGVVWAALGEVVGIKGLEAT